MLKQKADVAVKTMFSRKDASLTNIKDTRVMRTHDDVPILTTPRRHANYDPYPDSYKES